MPDWIPDSGDETFGMDFVHSRVHPDVAHIVPYERDLEAENSHVHRVQLDLAENSMRLGRRNVEESLEPTR
jgi:hypothetical protein